MNRRTFLKVIGATSAVIPMLPTYGFSSKLPNKWICLKDEPPKVGQNVVLLSYGTSSYLVNIGWIDISVATVVTRGYIANVNSIYARTRNKNEKLPYQALFAYNEDISSGPSMTIQEHMPIDEVKSLIWVKDETKIWRYSKPFTLLTGETLIHSNAFWLPTPPDLNDIFPLPKIETRTEKLYHKC